jgi:serine protease Do
MKYLVRAAGLAAMVLSLHSTGFAQTGEDHDDKNKLGDNDEIVIKPKIDKDVTVTVEIKDGRVFIDGKPVDKFVDSAVSVHKKKIMVMDQSFSINGPDGEPHYDEHFKGPQGGLYEGGNWSIDGKNANRAMLGVNSVKAEDNIEGAKIKEVTKGSAAEKAGLKAGDLITRVNEIAISDPEALAHAVHKYKPQDKITLTYKRDGKEQKTTATLGKSDQAANFSFDRRYVMPDEQMSRNFNFTMPPMPDMDGARAFSWNDGKPKLGIKAQDMDEGNGARVLEVDDESPAEKAGIKEGDIITRFDDKDVENATMLADLARETAGKASVRISVTRDGKSREVEVKVPKKLKTADL